MGRYPMVVFGGLLLTVIAFMFSAARRERAVEGSALDGESNGAIAIIALAIALSVILIEAAGFVVSSIVLFWLTARAFDARHPMRDAIAAVLLSVGDRKSVV